MSKDTTQIKKSNNYDTKIIERLVEKYGVSRVLVYKALRNESDSETAESLRQDYALGEKYRKQALQKI
jgi:hypothetical protein